MKPIRHIITALCLLATVFMSSCSAYDAEPGASDFLNNSNKTEIKLYLSGVVKSTTGETLSGIHIHIQGTEYTAESDSNGLFVLESTKAVTSGNANETVLLIATDSSGSFIPRITEVTIGEWYNGQKTIGNIEIVMEPVAAAN